MEKSLRAFARFSDGSLPVKPTLSVSAARFHLSQRERQRISWIQLLTMGYYRLRQRCPLPPLPKGEALAVIAKFVVLPKALPSGELAQSA